MIFFFFWYQYRIIDGHGGGKGMKDTSQSASTSIAVRLAFARPPQCLQTKSQIEEEFPTVVGHGSGVAAVGRSQRELLSSVEKEKPIVVLLVGVFRRLPLNGKQRTPTPTPGRTPTRSWLLVGDDLQRGSTNTTHVLEWRSLICVCTDNTQYNNERLAGCARRGGQA